MKRGYKIVVINRVCDSADIIHVSDATAQIVCKKPKADSLEWEDCETLLKYWGYSLNDCSFTYLREGEKINEVFH